MFEIFGPVQSPFYSVRFNSAADIEALGVSIGDEVYFAPEESEFTTYVFVNQLKA